MSARGARSRSRSTRPFLIGIRRTSLGNDGSAAWLLLPATRERGTPGSNCRAVWRAYRCRSRRSVSRREARTIPSPHIWAADRRPACLSLPVHGEDRHAGRLSAAQICGEGIVRASRRETLLLERHLYARHTARQLLPGVPRSRVAGKSSQAALPSFPRLVRRIPIRKGRVDRERERAPRALISRRYESPLHALGEKSPGCPHGGGHENVVIEESDRV